MKHTAFGSWSPVLLLCLLSLSACNQDTQQTVLADCGGRIPRERVHSCLDRVRLIDETDPSAGLQSLEARLDRRAKRHQLAQVAPPSGYEPDQGPSRGYGNYGSDDRMPHNQGGPANEPPPPPSSDYDQNPPPEGPRGDVSPPSDDTGPGDLTPPDDTSQGPPPDNTPPPDDSETQGPGQ